MKNKFFLTLIALAALLMTACATGSSSTTIIKAKPIKDSSKSELVAIGPTQMIVLGPVFYIQESKPCSKLDLLMAASKKYANMSDVINIEMEEKTNQQGMVRSVSCKYYGLAVAYTPMTKETLETIKELRSVKSDSGMTVNTKIETLPFNNDNAAVGDYQ